jgi:YegS/Rv2252/BmrU family lipid kinase
MAVAVIINPISGHGRAHKGVQRAELATSLLEAAGEPGEVFVTTGRGHAKELAAGAVARGARLVMAWGGDGTVNEVASALAFTSVALGIVPSGSGNGLARALGVARQPSTAIGDALRATPRVIDAGELGGRLFFSVAGVGFDAHVASCFDQEPTGRGLTGYARVSARELFSYHCARYRITIGPPPGVVAEQNALLVTLANSSQFGNGATIAPAARVDDGRLDLVVFEERSRLRTMAAIPWLFVGDVTRVDGVSIRQVERATIETNRLMRFHVDGEPVQGSEVLEAMVHPAALRVAVR